MKKLDTHQDYVSTVYLSFPITQQPFALSDTPICQTHSNVRYTQVSDTLIKPRQLCWAGFIAMLMYVCAYVCVSVCLSTRYLKNYLTNQLLFGGSLPSDPGMK